MSRCEWHLPLAKSCCHDLRRLLARNAAVSGKVRRAHAALKIAQLTIDKMKVELASLRRMKYGAPASGSKIRNSTHVISIEKASAKDMALAA